MGGGASVPSDMKAKIHTAFDMKTVDGWANAEDLKTEADLRAEVTRLRQLALACVNDKKHDNKAVMDKIDLTMYKPKNVEKTPSVMKLITKAMQENILFKRCRELERKELLDNFDSVTFAPGQTIIEQGSKGEDFYIVESGSCEVYLQGTEKPVAFPKSGSSFGELALMYNTPRAATVVAKEKTVCWKIARHEFRLVLAVSANKRSKRYKELLSSVMLHNKDKTKNKLLKDCITDDQLTRLADAMDEETCEEGKTIIREGDVGHTFFIIAEGKVDCSTKRDGKVAEFEAGGYFGDRALVTDEKRAATCTAVGGPVRLLAVDRDDFVSLLGSIEDLVESGSSTEAAIVTHHRKAEKISRDDIEEKRVLGHGAFGRVKLVTHKTTGVHYALKSQQKHAIVENNLQDHVLMERDILMQLDHPFILKLVSSFQDAEYIYFLLELLIGGELFSHLRKMGRFSEQMMRFYAASVVLAFEHMHSKKIAYRDLKPENLVLDSVGFVKIVDLGLAKVVTSKTWTLCGTPDYLAPEIILNEGHDKAVDYWALGVLMYELVAGVPPFYADDPMEVYEKILSGSMSFPSHLGKYLSDIVRKLLKLCQSKRLGNGKGGCGAIKKHRFFSGFPWDELVAKSITPPIEVKIAHPADASNFETYPDEPENALPVDWTPKLDED